MRDEAQKEFNRIKSHEYYRRLEAQREPERPTITRRHVLGVIAAIVVVFVLLTAALVLTDA